MLKKSSLFMMLLLLAASIVGISTVYMPADIETQSQPQQPQQMLPNSGRLLGQLQQPQQQQQQQAPGTQGLVTQKEFQTTSQILTDTLLLDRLFPQIVKRLDGKTLATKVLPFLDITATVNPRYSQPLKYDAPADVARDLGLTGQEPAKISKVGCNEGEMAVGGGFSFRGDPQDDYLSISGPNGQNEWASGAVFAEGGTIQSYVTCLTINVGLKGTNQPAQPAQPPGGPALQPPLKLR
jgi:hypothetical protein